jgi:tetratricopeptide (TPR) repeat protein
MTLKNQAINQALEGNWESAITINKTLIKENSSDLDALNRLGLAYTITGKLKEAKSAYQKVLKIDSLNSIALRNLKKLKEKGFTVKANQASYTRLKNNFLEEPGKTKVVELVNIAPPKVVEAIRTGQSVNLLIKRLKIFVLEDKEYIGVLPDDIARRLIKFIKGGCIYDAYIKSSTPHKVTIFIKEVKKTIRFKDQPSFIFTGDNAFTLDKNGKIRAQVENQRLKNNVVIADEEEEQDANYSEEE